MTTTQTNPQQRRFASLAPWIVLGVVTVIHVALLIQSFGIQRLWEDEAFNLSVPLNLLAGLGYTSDGTLTGSFLIPFDVRISTGPVVMLPAAALMALGIDPVVAGRLVAAGYWVLLVTALALLGRRIAGPWGAVIAAATPLTLHTNYGNSPIQGPADFLGEGPAAALIVTAVLLMRHRPALAGLVAGLAIQAKFIALLAMPALALGLLVMAAAPARRWIPVLWKPVLLAMVPTALYELAALWRLGLHGFRVHLYDFREFLFSSGQFHAPNTVGQKLDHFASSWFVPSGIVWAVAIIGIALIAYAVWKQLATIRPLDADTWSVLGVLVTASFGLITYLGWWATSSHTPLWIRHPSVALLAFVPILAACLAWAIRKVRAQRVSSNGVSAPALVTAVVVVGLSAVMSWQAAAQVTQAYGPRAETLQSQRAVAAELKETAGIGETERDGSQWLAARPWGASVNIVFLTGVHIGLSDAQNMAETPSIGRGECEDGTEPVAVSGAYSLCQP